MMSEVIKLQDCERPEVVVVSVAGKQGASSTDMPLLHNPTEIYKEAKTKAELDIVNKLGKDIGLPTLNSQMDEFAYTVGTDAGLAVKSVKEAKQIGTEAVELSEEAREVSNNAFEKSVLAITHAENAIGTATSANQISAEAKSVAETSMTSAKANADRAEKISGEVAEAETRISSLASDCEQAKNVAVANSKSAETHAADAQNASVVASDALARILEIQGLMISLGRKDVTESINGQEEKQIFVRFARRAEDPSVVGISITRRSEWSEGDVSRVTLEYDGISNEGVTVWIRNKGVNPCTIRFSVLAYQEL